MSKQIIKANNVPAVSNETQRAKLYKQLLQKLDEVQGEFNILSELDANLRRNFSLMEDRLPVPEEYEVYDDTREQIATCRRLMAELDGKDRYDDDGVLGRDVIAPRLAWMYGSMPTNPDINQEVFPQSLVNHVADVDNLTYLALESACREFQLSGQKAPGKIADVIEMLEKHIELWRVREFVLDSIERLATKIALKVEDLREEVEVAKKEAAIRKAHEAWESAKSKMNWKRKTLVDKQNIAAELADKIMLGFHDLKNFYEPAVQRAEAALIEAGGDPDEDPLAAKSNVGGI